MKKKYVIGLNKVICFQMASCNTAAHLFCHWPIRKQFKRFFMAFWVMSYIQLYIITVVAHMVVNRRKPGPKLIFSDSLWKCHIFKNYVIKKQPIMFHVKYLLDFEWLNILVICFCQHHLEVKSTLMVVNLGKVLWKATIIIAELCSLPVGVYIYMIFSGEWCSDTRSFMRGVTDSFCKEGALHINLQHYALNYMVLVNGDGLL